MTTEQTTLVLEFAGFKEVPTSVAEFLTLLHDASHRAIDALFADLASSRWIVPAGPIRIYPMGAGEVQDCIETNNANVDPSTVGNLDQITAWLRDNPDRDVAVLVCACSIDEARR